jgi:glycosyltransferase involved in cell wall biosynthesis
MSDILKKLCVMIPAFNEEKSLPGLLAEVRTALPGVHVLVINDGSRDATAQVAREHGAHVLNMPYNAGVGTAVQAGFQYAWQNGFKYLLRMDGDGQHPPSEAQYLLATMEAGDVDLVVGSRFGGEKQMISTRLRYLGVRGLAFFLSLICRSKVTDPTSGFWLVNRRLLYVFSHTYPCDYPEPEALAFVRRLGYSFKEVPVRFRPRMAGESSIGHWDTLFHAFKVLLALVVDRVRPVDVRLSAGMVHFDDAH